MIKTVEECARPLNRTDIDSLESRMNVKLPDEYKAFLLEYNGGRPSPNGFPITGLAKNPYGAIQVFFGIDDEIESCNIEWNWDTFAGRMPSNLMPIACTGSGDIICLSLFGDDAGAVVFWDFYGETDAPSYGNVYSIAASFSGFLDSIHTVPTG